MRGTRWIGSIGIQRVAERRRQCLELTGPTPGWYVRPDQYILLRLGEFLRRIARLTETGPASRTLLSLLSRPVLTPAREEAQTHTQPWTPLEAPAPFLVSIKLTTMPLDCVPASVFLFLSLVCPGQRETIAESHICNTFDRSTNRNDSWHRPSGHSRHRNIITGFSDGNLLLATLLVSSARRIAFFGPREECQYRIVSYASSCVPDTAEYRN